MIYVIVKTDGEYSDRTTENLFASTQKEIAENKLEYFLQQKIASRCISEKYSKALSHWVIDNPTVNYHPSKAELVRCKTPSAKTKLYNDHNKKYQEYNYSMESFRQDFLKENNLPFNYYIGHDTAEYYIEEVPSELNIFM
jgi:hypothetical protein